MTPKKQNEAPSALDVSTGAALLGTLTRAGSLIVNEDADCGLVISMTRDELRAVKCLPMYHRVAVITVEELQSLINDRERLDWLADRENPIGNVQLPRECVANNLTSMRDAIDQARRLHLPNVE